MISGIPVHPLRGSRALILQTLRRQASNNCCVMSYDQIAQATGYCTETVRISIKKLEQDRFIAAEKRLGERRNMYRILEV